MDSSGEEKKTAEEVSSAIGTMEAEQTEEKDQHSGKATLSWETSFLCLEVWNHTM